MGKLKTTIFGVSLFVGGAIIGVKGYHICLQILTKDDNFLGKIIVNRLAEEIVYGKEYKK
ncbi:MAG: hypothetical protein GX660_25585 [Clostridiaceae bacterium]|nr:hypothetical protein [Clostridiaceae bacterium]